VSSDESLEHAGNTTQTAEHSYFSSSSLCSSSLSSYTSIRLLCYNTYTRLNFIRNIHKLTLHTKTREERCASYASAYIRDKMARQRSSKQRHIPHPYKDSGDQRHRTQTYMNSSVLRLLGPLEIEASSPCSRPLTYSWNRWLQAS